MSAQFLFITCPSRSALQCVLQWMPYSVVAVKTNDAKVDDTRRKESVINGNVREINIITLKCVFNTNNNFNEAYKLKSNV